MSVAKNSNNFSQRLFQLVNSFKTCMIDNLLWCWTALTSSYFQRGTGVIITFIGHYRPVFPSLGNLALISRSQQCNGWN